MWWSTCVHCPRFNGSTGGWPSKWRGHQQLWPRNPARVQAFCFQLFAVGPAAWKGPVAQKGPAARMGFAWAAQGACSSGTRLPVGFLCSIHAATCLGADSFPMCAPLPWLPAARGEAAAICYLWWIWTYYCMAFQHADSTASCGEIAAWWIDWERPGQRYYYNTT